MDAKGDAYESHQSLVVNIGEEEVFKPGERANESGDGMRVDHMRWKQTLFCRSCNSYYGSRRYTKHKYSR